MPMKRLLITLFLVGTLLFTALSVSAAAPASHGSTPNDTSWAEAGFIPNEAANAAAVQCPGDMDQYYLIGGWGTVDPPIILLRYDSNNRAWTDLAALPKQLSSFSAVCYKGKIYVAGGEFPDINNDLYIYDIAANTWSSAAPAPRPVMGAALGAWDDRLYLVGGTQTHEALGMTPVNQVDVYDIDAGTWQADALPPMPEATSFPGYAQAGPYLYLVGGFSGNYDQNVTVTQRLDMSTGIWEIGPEFTGARAMLPAVVTAQYLYAVGGDSNGGDWLDAAEQVDQLDLSNWPGGSWQDLEDPLPEISQGNSSACTTDPGGGEVWSISGGYIDDDWNDHIYYSNLYYPAGSCINFGLTLAPANIAGDGHPGETVEYTLTVTNNGNTTDYFSLVSMPYQS
jgi:hypothetical protein